MTSADSPLPASDNPPAGHAAQTVAGPRHEGPGTRIGPYKLLQLIGEGGFGSVFMAEQERPVQRRVALKIIKLGMDTKQVIARFEVERQALAMMDHPNIAKVLDAGATETGRPYFVMELVKGEPITDYCDKHNLSVPERLALFQQVCHAVQHAHQKGVIHRDLKPSNIMITLHDGKPVPMVIDFGIAKATANRLTDKTLFTEYRQLIGTPEYMSPEQAEMSGLDIDTRSDVYSLGVVLYELLTGSTPLAAERLRSAAFDEMQRMIREEMPPRPSTRLSTLQTLSSVASHRHTDGKRLGVSLRGDLDWIVMKALEKDRQRRYDTANGLALDIGRHLADQPVTAGPPSTAYRVSKFVRRNRAAVVSAAAVFAALLAGFATTVWWARQAIHERSAALVARENAERTSQFMGEILNGAGPSVARGRDTTMLKEMLDASASRIDKGDLKGAAESEVRLRKTIGDTYCFLGRFAESAAMLEPAVALARKTYTADHPDLAASLESLARLERARGRLAAADPLSLESLDMNKRLHPGDSREVASSLHLRGMVLRNRGDHVAGEALLREALAMRQRVYRGDHAEVADVLLDLGWTVKARGDFAAAEPLTRDAVAMFKRLFSGDHPDVAGALGDLAVLLEDKGALADSESLHRESLAMKKRLIVGDHPSIATGLNNLGRILEARGDLAGAEANYRESIDMKVRLFKGDHIDLCMTMTSLAYVLMDRGDLDGAESIARDALAMSRRLFPGDHQEVATALDLVSGILEARGDLFGSEATSRESLGIYRRLYPGDHQFVSISLGNLGARLKKRGDLAGAESLNQESLDMSRRLFPGVHPDVAFALWSLACVKRDRGDLDGAEPLLREGLDMCRRLFEGDHSTKALQIIDLARLLELRGDLSGALVLAREGAAMTSRTAGENSARAGLARLTLGSILSKSGQYEEARSELVEAERVLSTAAGVPQAKYRACIDAIASLYAAWNKAEPGNGYDAKAAEWKAKAPPQTGK